MFDMEKCFVFVFWEIYLIGFGQETVERGKKREVLNT